LFCAEDVDSNDGNDNDNDGNDNDGNDNDGNDNDGNDNDGNDNDGNDNAVTEISLKINPLFFKISVNTHQIYCRKRIDLALLPQYSQ
jgi:hypothetical protein